MALLFFDLSLLSFADSLKINNQLTDLFLDVGSIDDVGASNLADALKYNVPLECLYLFANERANYIGDDGAMG
jgi:hypothetical protein